MFVFECLLILQTAFAGISIDAISKKEAFNLLKERNPDLTTLIERRRESTSLILLRINNISLDQYGQFVKLFHKKEICFYDKDALDRKYLELSEPIPKDFYGSKITLYP